MNGRSGMTIVVPAYLHTEPNPGGGRTAHHGFTVFTKESGIGEARSRTLRGPWTTERDGTTNVRYRVALLLH
jgi:hypothetical protein